MAQKFPGDDEEQASLNTLLGPSSEETTPTILPAMIPSGDNKEMENRLQQISDYKTQLNTLAGLVEAGGKIGAAIGRTTNTASGDPIRKLATVPEEQMKLASALEEGKLKKQLQQEKLNRTIPTSLYSRSIQLQNAAQFPELAKRFGKQWYDLPADTIETVVKNHISGSTLDLKNIQQGQLEAAREANRIQKQSVADEKHRITERAFEDKKLKDSTVSDKQLEAINNFDTSTSEIDNIASKIKSNYVGPVDSRIPDLLVGADEAAFRSSVGRMNDQYRKLITGVAAGDKELRRLESRLPNTTDTYANFLAKAKELREGMAKAKERYLNNLEKKHKNVDDFKEGSSANLNDPRILKFMADNPKVKSKEEAYSILKDAGKL